MAKKTSGTELFIVDNSDQDWKVREYLREWCQLSERIDIATGYFEIGSLLALGDEWQKVDHIRILMGDEVSLRTKQAFTKGLSQAVSRLDSSIEAEKQNNDFLVGVPAIVGALRTGKIACRVYRKDKFHAKAYITHGRQEVVGSFALVGSSNFTFPGLSDNVELNVRLAGSQVGTLQEWYDDHWERADDVTPDILKTIERHTREYTPFEVYARSLQEYFRSHEMTAPEWELADLSKGGSHMYSVLDQYQKEGYQAMMKIARQHRGAFLCDGVGLGKTFIGLMIIERLIMHERKRVALFVPKAARADVWEVALRRYLPHVGGVSGGDFSNLVILNHTDFGRAGDFPDRFARITEIADAIVIDEAHHFRNPGVKGTGERRPSRYRMLFDLIDGPRGPKQLFMLTATPINNRLHDFRHMIELFSRQQEDYFRSTVGVHSLRGHFVSMEREVKQAMEAAEDDDDAVEINLSDAEMHLAADALFRALVVQRSRAYVKKSQLQQGSTVASFPTREPPKVVEYSVKKTYGRLLDLVDKALTTKDEPLFVLGIYYPLAYYKGDPETIDPWIAGRQKQVVGLIRTGFLKRFESSAHAFERSCDRLLLKLLTWVTKHSETGAEKRRLELWKQQNADLIGYVQHRQYQLFGGEEDEADADEDLVTEEMLETVNELSREEYKVEEILADTFFDLNEIGKFLDELRKFKPRHDDKLKALVRLLKNDPVLQKHKALIFTEFAETARYLKSQLIEAGIEGVEQIDSGIKADRGKIIRRFAPYYNGSCSAKLAEAGEDEIRILISTDVLSEGLNLQDATRLINYDLHWNPVRLMQRIGRVDRRMNPEIEEQLLADHPDQKKIRGKVAYWNFLPPDEIENLLRLYNRVAHKTLRISKTSGIEGGKLLTPKDDFDALRDFNHAYEGATTPVEEMHLEYQQMLKDYPDLAARLAALPGRVFSGKESPKPGTTAVFFCYARPAKDTEIGEWSVEAGDVKWYLYDIADEKIIEEPGEIIEFIRSKPETPRVCQTEQETLVSIRKKLDDHIKKQYLRKVQAPGSVKPVLRTWMELN